MRPPNQQAQGIAHRSEIGSNVNRVRDKEEADDGVQQPSGIMTANVTGNSAPGRTPNPAADLLNGRH